MFRPKHWMICLKRNKVDLGKSRGIGVKLAEEIAISCDMLRVESGAAWLDEFLHAASDSL